MMPVTADIIIRPATSADVEAISRLVTHLSRKFITPDYTDEGVATLLSNQSPEAIDKVLSDGVLYLVAEADSVLVGAAGLIRTRRHLYHLFVDRAFQRRGIGRRLWEALCADLDPGPITVNSSRLAIGFYERLGFASSGPSWEKDGVIAYPMQWNSGTPTTTKSQHSASAAGQ